MDNSNTAKDSRKEKQENTTVPANTAKPPGPSAGHPLVLHPGNDENSALLSHTQFTAENFPSLCEKQGTWGRVDNRGGWVPSHSI